MLERAKLLQDSIVSDRREIHANPELGFEEHETAKMAANNLRALNFEVKEGIGKTGVVADYGKGKTVAIRADMDGLPIEEAVTSSFKSRTSGVMHACGHDAHVACGIAAAKLLKEVGFTGRVRMLMQPSEERGDAEGKSGAARMIEDGAMKDVSSVIGLHVYSPLPMGKVAIKPGPIMASADSFLITIIGQGGHGAYPDTTVDPITLSSLVVQAVQNIVSRKLKAGEPAVLSICAIESSTNVFNVTPDRVTMKGTIRAFSEETRAMLRSELEKACSIVKAVGGDYKLEYDFGFALTVNNEQITEVMRQAACDLIGSENVVLATQQMGSEDFSLLANEAPGAFMFVGIGFDDGDIRRHHHPKFDMAETHLYTGAAILAETARRLML